jgi:hypothetical protein
MCTGDLKPGASSEILGITLDDIDQLEAEIRAGILQAAVTSTRDNASHGVNCVVDVPIRGIADKQERIVSVRTVWELTDRDAVPRLVTAYPKP